jgi:ribonuclease R
VDGSRSNEGEHANSPWSKRADKKQAHDGKRHLIEFIPLDKLHDIAEDSSLTERRADGAERELTEWKKIKFMENRVGEDFSALVISVTKYGLFVELDDLFIEGLVPIGSLSDDRFTYHENTRQIIGERSGHAYSIGDRIRVILDRIDRVQRKLQFSILQERPLAKRRDRPKASRSR